MGGDPLITNGQTVDSLSQMIGQGKTGLSYVPGLVKVILQKDMWRKRWVERLDKVIEFERFADFVATAPLEGLGATVDLLKDMCHRDTEVLDLLDRVTVAKHGTNQHTAPKLDRDNITVHIEEPDRGTSRQYALRKLRKDRPDLHQQVIVGDKTPHAAMVEAGFRRKTITIPTDVDRVATILQRHFSEEELRKLIALLLPN